MLFVVCGSGDVGEEDRKQNRNGNVHSKRRYVPYNSFTLYTIQVTGGEDN